MLRMLVLATLACVVVGAAAQSVASPPQCIFAEGVAADDDEKEVPTQPPGFEAQANGCMKHDEILEKSLTNEIPTAICQCEKPKYDCAVMGNELAKKYSCKVKTGMENQPVPESEGQYNSQMNIGDEGNVDVGIYVKTDED